LTCDAEVEYVNKYFSLKYWPILASKILYNEDNEELTEMFSAMFAMTEYDNLKAQKDSEKEQLVNQKREENPADYYAER
jgi:hypothetical protein